MSQSVLVSRNFDLGFQSDGSRDGMPRGAAWRLRDYIPQLEAPARKRGGWGLSSADLNGLSAAISMSAVGWAPFSGDPHLIALSEVGKVYRMTTFSGSSGAFVAATHGQPMTHRPFWHRDRMIIPAQLGAAAANPYKYYDTGGAAYTTAVVGGTPPQARMGFSYGDYLALGNAYVSGTLYNYRLFFSGVGNSDSWTLTGPTASYWDFPEEILAGVQLRNVILVWGYSNTWMIQGTTPPPAGNFAKYDLFKGNGIMDGRSLATWREYAIWANDTGVYRTDGSTLTNLTKNGGIVNYYRALAGSFSFQQGWRAAAGIYRDFYFITITNGAGAIVTTLVCDLDRQVWFEFTNFPVAMYAERNAGPGTVSADGHEELFFAHATLPRAGFASSAWAPSLSTANDGDGTVVLPSVETPFYKLDTVNAKRIRRARIGYDVRTAGGSPLLRVSALLSPERTTYTQLSPDLPTTTKQEREEVQIRDKALGVAFKIDQVGASADTRLYDIELEGNVLGANR